MLEGLSPSPRPEAGLAARTELIIARCLRLREAMLPLPLHFLYWREGRESSSHVAVPADPRSIDGHVVCGHFAHLALRANVHVHRILPATLSHDDDL